MYHHELTIVCFYIVHHNTHHVIFFRIQFFPTAHYSAVKYLARNTIQIIKILWLLQIFIIVLLNLMREINIRIHFYQLYFI